MSPTGQPLATANCHSAFKGGTMLTFKQRPEMLRVRRVLQTGGEEIVTKHSPDPLLIPAGQWLITRLTAVDKPKRLASGLFDVWSLPEDRLLGAYNLLQHERLASEGFASSRYLGMTLHAVLLSTVTSLDLPNTDFQVIDPVTGKPVTARATAEDLLVALDFSPTRGTLGNRSPSCTRCALPRRAIRRRGFRARWRA